MKIERVFSVEKDINLKNIIKSIIEERINAQISNYLSDTIIKKNSENTKGDVVKC